MNYLNKFNEAKRSRKSDELQILEKEMIKLKEKFQIIFRLNYDWKEINEDVYKDFKKVVKELGGYFYSDPSTEGSDCYGIIISKKSMSKADLNLLEEISDEIIDEDGDPNFCF